jgi:hypothetical protein
MMKKHVITIDFGGTFLRARKEKVGCLIFDSQGKMLEGNDSVWEIIFLFEQGYSMEEIVVQLSNRYHLPTAVIEKSMQDFQEEMLAQGWNIKK